MNLDDFLSRLDHVRKSGAGFTALCPGHEDVNPSLSVSEEGEKILVYCHTGCKTEHILSKMGLKMADLFLDNGHGPSGKVKAQAAPPSIVATYDYTSASGEILFQTVRFTPKDFRQRRLEQKGGWVWNLQGIKPVLYRLPQVLAAVQAGERVFVCEGEKDCDNLAALGLTATTAPMGAGKWRPSYSEALVGADVVILPDNDRPGKDHAEQVARSLHGKARSVRVLDLPGLPDKGDVSDWLASGGSREELERLSEATPTWSPPAEPNKAPPWAIRGEDPSENFLSEIVKLQIISFADGEQVYKVFFSDGRCVEVSGNVLLSFPRFKVKAMDVLRAVPPQVSRLKWEQFINYFLPRAEIISRGEDETVIGLVSHLIDEAVRHEERLDPEKRRPEQVARNLVLLGEEGHEEVALRLEMVVNLTRGGSDPIKVKPAGKILRELGFTPCLRKILGRVWRVWVIELHEWKIRERNEE